MRSPNATAVAATSVSCLYRDTTIYTAEFLTANPTDYSRGDSPNVTRNCATNTSSKHACRCLSKSPASWLGTIPPSVRQPTNRTLEEAVGNATNYLAQTQDPYTLLNLNVIYRRFGITEFANSLNRYDQLLAKNTGNAALLRVFRRIADYDNTPQTDDFYAVTDNINQITVPALYSDRSILPDYYMSELNDAANSGGYLLTHALLATIWLQENHCELPIPSDFKEFLYHANAGLIGNGSVVNDLEVEAAAFLYLAGQGALVSDAFVQRVIATQNYDGGWSAYSDTPVSSYDHTSVLALMLLLHVEFPAASYPLMLAPATSYNSVCLNPLAVCSIAVCLFAFVNIRKKTMQSRLNHQWLINVKQSNY